MNEKRLKEAAENAYNAWMGGTMNDVREAMKELGEVLEDCYSWKNRKWKIDNTKLRKGL